jgi:hypothetical protein
VKRAWGIGAAVAALAWVAACNTDDSSDVPDVGVGGSAGAGGSGSGGCTLDTLGSAGAVSISTIVPPEGSWCPSDGVEICTDGVLGTFPLVLSDGGVIDPPPTRSRCVDNAWENTEVDACERASHPGCNIPARFTDGACCTAVRYCFEAFCDGERWWTTR